MATRITIKKHQELDCKLELKDPLGTSTVALPVAQEGGVLKQACTLATCTQIRVKLTQKTSSGHMLLPCRLAALGTIGKAK